MSTKVNKYNNFDHILVKIKEETPPCELDKENLLYKINNRLTKKDHMFFFTEILQKMEKKVYSITPDNTLFDLNDLPYSVFWKLVYHTEIFLENHKKQRLIREREQEYKQQDQNFNDNLAKQLIEHLNDPNQSMPEPSSLTNYERLRIDALSQCKYSTYSKFKDGKIDLSLSDDKKLTKNIYSDHYHHHWKDRNVSSNESSVETIEDDDDDDDEPKMISEEIDAKEELNRLLKIQPKRKIKLTRIN